jgi:hypothetical protein
MAHAFTPGLKVTESLIVRKTRRLPLLGEVLVAVGDRVRATDVVARTELPGKVYPVNLANTLGVLPEEIPERLLKEPGEKIARDEIIAESVGFFGMFKSHYRSPIDGTLDHASTVTGQVMLRGHPTPVEVQAYVDGTITEVIENEGVVVTTAATLIQGIFGLGGERQGAIRVVCEAPDEVLTPEKIDGYCKGKIVVGGAFASLAALKKAFDVGATGVIVGGFDYGDIKALLGYEVGVAITGGEKIPSTLIVTEGFGRIAMARRTHAILKRHEEQVASINGATQIRAGVIRPEVIIARPDEALPTDVAEAEPEGLDVGALIRVIRFPHFGRIGKVTALPAKLERMASETEVRVLEVTFEDGETAILPRSNIEMIEG